jgi:hypothetical protein
MAPEQGYTMKDKARELLIAAKIFQFCADIFAIFGLFLFAYIYFTNFKDNPFAALQSPYFVVTVLIPFIPAAAMSFIASKKRSQLRALLEENDKSA